MRAQPQYVSIISAALKATNRFIDRATFALIWKRNLKVWLGGASCSIVLVCEALMIASEGSLLKQGSRHHQSWRFVQAQEPPRLCEHN